MGKIEMVKDEELPIINALWIGDQLGAISRACLTSFVMRGHQVHLHTYGEIKDLPEGVMVKSVSLPSSAQFITRDFFG